MAGSLLDIGALTGQALDLARMAQYQDRVDLSEERLAFAKQKQAQDQATDRISAMIKIADNELLPTDIRIKVAGRTMKELDPSLEFSDEDLTSGYRAVIAASRKAIDPTVPTDEKIAAWDEAAVRVPGLAGKLQAIQEKSGTIDDRRERLYNELELQKLKIRDLKHQQDHLEIRDGLFSTAGGILTQLTDSVNLQDAEKKRSFNTVFQKALSAKDETERKILLAGSKDLEAQFQTKIHGVQQAAMLQFGQWRNELEPLKGAVEQAKAEGREVQKEDLEKVAAYELVTNAEDDLNAWVSKPYDKQAWNRLQTTLQQVKIAQSGTKKQLAGLDGTRMEMLKNAQRKTDLEFTKEETKRQREEDLAAAQVRFGMLDAGEQTPKSAAMIAKDYKGILPEDVMKATKNPNAPIVDIKMGDSLSKEIGPMLAESRTAAMGAIETVDTVNRAQAAIDKGLVNVGPTATVRTMIGQVANVLGVSGKNMDEQLVNTRNVMRSLAQFSLAARKALKGQGQVSDFEGKLLIKAESGEIDDMTLPELKGFLAVTDRLARRQYETHQRAMKTLRANPRLSEIAPFYDVPELPLARTPTGESAIRSDADYEKLPSGAVFIDPEGKRRRKP